MIIILFKHLYFEKEDGNNLYSHICRHNRDSFLIKKKACNIYFDTWITCAIGGDI